MSKKTKQDLSRNSRKSRALKEKARPTSKDTEQPKEALPDDLVEKFSNEVQDLSDPEKEALRSAFELATRLFRPGDQSMEDAGPLADKLVLVTNASGGMGASIALAMAEAGAHAFLHYKDHEEQALKIKAEIEQLNRQCVLHRADLSNAAEVHDLVSMIEKHHSHVDVLINNPTTHVPRSVEGTDEGIWDRTLNGNLGAAYHLIEAIVPGMITRKWGRIINLTSMMWQIGGGCPPYVASMAGLIGLTRAHAGRLAKDGVTANAITLGIFEGEETTTDPPISSDLIPVLRYGNSEQVIIVILMLACNDYITGQSINVNGGVVMS